MITDNGNMKNTIWYIDTIVSDPGAVRPPKRSHGRGPDLQFASGLDPDNHRTSTERREKYRSSMG